MRLSSVTPRPTFLQVRKPEPCEAEKGQMQGSDICSRSLCSIDRFSQPRQGPLQLRLLESQAAKEVHTFPQPR